MRDPSVWWLLPSVALGAVSLTLLSPIMPVLKASWFEGSCDRDAETRCHFKKAQEISGIVSSVRFLIVFLMSAYLGRLSDRIGRIPLLRMSNIGALLPILALLFTDGESAFGYYSAFILSGFVSSGTFQVVAYVADCTPSQDRARHFGYLGAVQGLALVVTPLISGFISQLSYSTLFAISAGILALNGVYIELVLPESCSFSSREAQEEAETPAEAASPFAHWHEAVALVRNNPVVTWLVACTLFTALPEQGVVEIVFIYLSDVLGLDEGRMREFTALYMSLTGVGVFVAQSLFMWILMKKMHLGPIGLLGISILANILHLFGYASLSLNHSETVAFSNIAVTSFMFVGQPAGSALLSRRVLPTEQGLAMGTLDSIRSLVGAFGPVLFSMLYSFFGKRYNYPEAPFLFGAAFASVALLIVFGPLRKLEKRIGDDDIHAVEEIPVVTEPLLGSEGIAPAATTV